MKTAFGYFLSILFIPIFAFLVSLTVEEAGKVQSVSAYLDSTIKINEVRLNQSGQILDANNRIIEEIGAAEKRVSLQSEGIPLFLKDLFILSEDQHFYEHPGFDLVSMGRAFSVNVQSRGINEGASTITQQLVRNVYLSHDRTYNRKLSEILYAYQLERRLSKEKILESYINAIYFQNGAYGIEAAADTYFQKPTASLSRSELAFLAAIPNNPTLYDPFKNFKNTKNRQERLIDLLEREGYINKEESEAIKNESIILHPKKVKSQFPDYTDYVRTEFVKLIAQQEGFAERLKRATNAEQREAIEAELDKRSKEGINSGVKIYTALDPVVQVRAAAAIQKHLPYHEIEGASISIRQGEIVSLIGGKNYQEGHFNRSYQAYRQPGSAIKPLLVYAPYLEESKAVLTDKISGTDFCDHGFCPRNYAGKKIGMVSILNAFSHSYNTPAVKLLKMTGIEKAFTYLDKFHFQKVTSKDHVPSSAIGGFTDGITPLEMTSAYTSFSRDGIYKPARAIRKVTDLEGKVLYEWHDPSERVWSEETNRKMRELLSETVKNGTARKAAIPTAYAGGKTGTTNDYKDYWFVGLTDELTTGVWVGRDRPQSMEAIEKTAPHLLIWKDTVSK